MMISIAAVLLLASASGRNLASAADTLKFRREHMRYPFPSSTEDVTGTISSLLLDKAVPLKDYPGQFGSANDNMPEFMSNRLLEDNGDDDSYYDVNTMHDFSSYSLKYTSCQKVQRFSSDAIEEGESSPLVTNDVVILRLCPQRRCSDDAELGCSVGYGEYVIDLQDYLKIMMQYEMDKKRNLCGLCVACVNGYGDHYYSGYTYGQRDLEDGGGDDDAAAATDDDFEEGGVCATYYSDMCYNYEDWCIFDEDGEEAQDENEYGYAIYNDYMEYFGCVEVEDDMYVNPRCDPMSGQISMGIFYDPYCSKYAGDTVNINAVVDVNFQSDAFDIFKSGKCIQCESSSSPPYYNSNNNLCNKMYQKSGKCNSYIAYDFGENDDGVDEGDGELCAYVESLRDGVYDKSGLFSLDSSSTGKVTTTQIGILVGTAVLCFILGLYSCYLHHEITNLLLKSLAQKSLMDEVARKAAIDREQTRESEKLARTSSRNIARHGSRGGSRSSMLGKWGRKKKKVVPTDDRVEADRSLDGYDYR